MTVTDYIKKSDDQKRKLCQDFNPYDKNEWMIFKEVEKLFIDQFGNHKSIDKISCGLAPMLGPFNCIKVFIGKNRGKLIIPEYFQGFPIYKIYESKSKNYFNLVNS